MKIIFQNVSEHQNTNQISNSQTAHTKSAGASKSMHAGNGQTVSYSMGKDNSIVEAGKNRRTKIGSFSDIQKEAAAMDAGLQQDFMTVMSHTMSSKDFAKMEKDGFHFEDLDPKDAVNIVDKIKAELVRSGQNIVGYTDDIDIDTLKNAVGSEALANALKDSLSEADVTVTEDLAKEISKAYEMSQSLLVPDDGVYRYMLDNGLEGEIQDFYKAQSSGAAGAMPGMAKYYAEDINGYISQNAKLGEQISGLEDNESFLKQMDKVIEQAGLDIDEESRQQAKWILNQNLPLTAENLKEYRMLSSVQFPITKEHFAKVVADAIGNGKTPYEAKLVHSENMYEKAVSLLERYKNVEEIRLHMTAEVNIKLLKSDFSLDTASIEEVLKAVKEAEKELAEQYFPFDTNAVEKYQIYTQTEDVVRELPYMPAAVLGIEEILSKTPPQAIESGENWKISQKALARDSYETMMTAPRADMGDSIKKAFANVDDILDDLKIEITEENRRAVRILGYNRMEVTPENISLVAEADRTVKNVIEKMTPASVLKMIRDGVNPLERSFEQLNDYFDHQTGDFNETSESYSRFLYGLEQRNDITKEEREGFIGIYRLLNQIEKSDGAAVGNLVNTKAELHFSNLLSAVRSGKVKYLDIKADDTVGFLKEYAGKENSISEQIAKAFSEDSYYESKLQSFRDSIEMTNEEVMLLQRANVPVNAGNILAAQLLLKENNQIFGNKNSRLQWKERDFDITSHMEDKETFSEEVAEAFDSFISRVEDNLMDMAETSVDVRDLQLVHKQLTVASALSRNEEYILPMELLGKTTKVHLTLKQGSEIKGNVDLSVIFENGSRMEAHLQLEKEQITGYLLENGNTEVMDLTRVVDIFSSQIKEDDTFRMDAKLSILDVKPKNTGINRKAEAGIPNEEKENVYSNTQLYRVAKIFLQSARMACEE